MGLHNADFVVVKEPYQALFADGPAEQLVGFGINGGRVSGRHAELDAQL